MKSFTFKGLVALAVAVCALAGVAQATNLAIGDWSGDDFEAYTNGEYIANAPNGWWQAETNTYVMATNAPANDAPCYPLEDSTHNIVAQLNTGGSVVSNTYEASSDVKVWIDMNVQLVPWGAGETPSIVTNDTETQTAMFLGTNGMLTVFHSLPDDASTWGAASTNYFTELSHDPIATGSWHRLTVEMDYKSCFAQYGIHAAFFRVLLDGIVVSNDTMAWPAPDSLESGTGGAWFLTANSDLGSPESRRLNATLFAGTGYVDDFLVTNTAVTCEIGYTVVASVDPADWGSVDQASQEVAADNDATVVLTRSNFWDVADILTNGVSTGETGDSYTWSNVTVNGSIEFVLQAQTNASYGVPLWWLDKNGLSTSGDTGAEDDSDNDGRDAWEEWLASTSLSSSNRFEITEIGSENGSNYVEWVVDGEIDPDLGPFVIEKATNLVEGWTTPYGTKARSLGTLRWYDSDDADAYYRLKGSDE